MDSTGVYDNKIKPDILILTQSTKVNLDCVLSVLNPKTVIIDASNSSSIQKIWKTSCLKKISLFTQLAKRDSTN